MTRRAAVCIALLLGVLSAFPLSSAPVGQAASRPESVPPYHNPVFVKPFPDPMVLRLGRHDYWAYATSVPWESGYFPILHSTDLVHWKYMGDIFRAPPAWATGDLWAPDVVKRAGTYYAYYTANSRTPGHCIGVATASRPQGPFRARNVVSCGDANGFGYIDPDLFIDSNGRAYLYVSADSPHGIIAVPMKPDLRHRAGPSTLLFGVSQPWESGAQGSTVEGPFVVRRGKTYYVFYSANSFTGPYAMGVAMGSSPTGPFTKYAGNPILKGNAKVLGPGGGSVVKGPDGRLWMAYHAWHGPEGTDEDTRDLRIDPIIWHGGIPHVTVTP